MSKTNWFCLDPGSDSHLDRMLRTRSSGPRRRKKLLKQINRGLVTGLYLYRAPADSGCQRVPNATPKFLELFQFWVSLLESELMGFHFSHFENFNSFRMRRSGILVFTLCRIHLGSVESCLTLLVYEGAVTNRAA